MSTNVETTTIRFDPKKLDDDSLDLLEDDLAELNEEGFYIAATFPTGLIILEREDVRVETYTGAGTHRKRPDRNRRKNEVNDHPTHTEKAQT